jgi:ligand-binding sensor domain-containing protein
MRKFHRLYIVCALLGWLPGKTVVAQSPLEKVKFQRIEVSAGLSHSNVRCTRQDSRGFLWVGTEDGLNRYNGYDFKVYRKIEGDTASLLRNSINSIYEDSRGTLWVSTRGGGLHYYDIKFDRFIRVSEFSSNCNVVGFTEDLDKNFWISGTRFSHAFTARFDPATKQWKYFDLFESLEPICSIIPASKNEFWFGIWRTGFFKWNSETNALTHFLPEAGNPQSMVAKDVRKIAEDGHGNIWIAASEGLSKYETTTKKFTNFTSHGSPNTSLLVDAARDISIDGEYVWVATENGGLTRIHTTSHRVVHYLLDKNDPHSLSDNSVWSVYRDHQGRIWVGTFSKGLCVIDNLRDKFSELNIPLENDIVNAILKDSKGRIWIGTEGGLVLKNEKGVRHYKHDPARKGSLSSNPILSIYEDSKHQLWFGTWNGGINKYDELNDRFIRYLPDANDPESLPNPNVYSMLELARTHQLLVSSYAGLNVLKDEKKGIFERHFDVQHPSNNYLRTLYEDSKGNLWTGSIAELNLYSLETREYTRFNFNDDSVSFDFFINSILEDKQGQLWVGTNNGLHMLVDKKHMASYTIKDGLPSNIVTGILDDDKGNLWLSTTQGIAQFTLATKTFRNYNIDDGLVSNEFKPNACFKSNDGLLFFGGIGVNFFQPDKIRLNPFIPPVYITDFKIFNQSVEIGQRDSILRTQISQTKEIKLPEHYNFFTIEFAALNFSSSSKNQYAYKLEGFDQDWVQVGNQRSATFTNLDPGTYTFRVKGSNNDGLWNEEGASLVINILPPWWKTLWFKSLVLITLGAIMLTIYKLRIRSIRRQNIRLEELVVSRTKALQQANEKLIMREEEITAQNDELFVQREALSAQNEALQESKKHQLELYTQSIIEKSAIIERISGELEVYKSKSSTEQEQIEKFNAILNANILTEEDWDHFRKTFTDVYPNFFASLRFRFPDITNSELRLSALIKLNLSLKESGSMLGISAESVKKSRYRLKKKFALTEDESLEEFVKKIA